ncbi:unnamed protein product [Bursaphelenchus xylophilus]|uniref:(pine wood nematode) hypothetical protein n=1 Tax=Bursaphelenchus xylophilus TaxID=6326 RepID=A0A1I7SR52_BURXY|nr:unnamed protein product [Bursaphelenchus xylophilus]CAG9110841.1 unnamed protein product [Bursaphelenchus xylophilus]
MGSRWENLGHSEQELQRMAIATTTLEPTATNSVQQMIESFVRQEILPDNQFLCHYRKLRSPQPIQLICDLGCCPNGCCGIEDLARSSVGYGWAIGLLGLFVVLVIFVSIIYLLHSFIKKKKTPLYQHGIYGSENSQVGGIYYTSGHLSPQHKNHFYPTSIY